VSIQRLRAAAERLGIVSGPAYADNHKVRQSRVLRRVLAEGVEKGLFGLASGSAWDAEDAALRFTQTVDYTESQLAASGA
jgi:hypothetical protein